MDLISRAAAIDAIEAVFPVDPMKSEYAQGIACGAALAKTYIEQLPSAQQEQCKDAVSKASVLETYADLYDVFDDNKGIQNELHKVFDRINNLPSAQPESEDITFWKKRAREYEGMIKELVDEMARGIKIDSVLITEEGVVFKKEKPEQRWIPMTERLPDVAQRVLLSGHGQVMIGMLHSFGKYSLEPTGISYVYPKDDIEAWMPLPEPYKDDPCNGCGYLDESCVGEGCGKLTERKEGEA